MVVSLQQFRDRFPTAHIRSELLMVQGDQFVVQVTIETQAAGSASALAADPHLEVAEDRAQQRALAGLGWPVNAALALPERPGSPMPAADPLAAAEADDLGPFPSEELELPPEEPWTPLPAAELVQHRAPAVSQPIAVPAAKTKAAPKPKQPSSSVTPVEAVASQPEAGNAKVEPPADQTSPEASFAGAHLPAPINLSDVIAQTDIELRRLGWSVEQGREYLEQTYHKRSRHELSEDELIEFLCYLESQPL